MFSSGDDNHEKLIKDDFNIGDTFLLLFMFFVLFGLFIVHPFSMTDTTALYLLILSILILILVSPFLPKKAVNFLKRINKVKLTVLLLAEIVFWVCTHSIFGIIHTDGPYSGKVVDAATGETIKDAAVAAVWDKEHLVVVKCLTTFGDAVETVTDAEGRFTLPRTWTFSFWPLSWLDEPDLLVFKAGYDCHPPEMQYAWTSEDEKRRNMTKAEYHDKYFVPLEREKESLVQLNKAKTLKERKEVLGGLDISFISANQRRKVRHFSSTYRKGHGVEPLPLVRTSGEHVNPY